MRRNLCALSGNVQCNSLNWDNKYEIQMNYKFKSVAIAKFSEIIIAMIIIISNFIAGR